MKETGDDRSCGTLYLNCCLYLWTPIVRVTLGVTSLLTLSTQHANSQKSLPPVSYIKVTVTPESRYIQFVLEENANVIVICRRRMEREAKAKVVTSVLGADSVQFLAA